MTEILINQEVPDFSCLATGDKTIKLSDYRGSNVILYFYPKDSTPGCTQEGKDFSAHFMSFQELDTIIFGISRDGIKAHENFKKKQVFAFDSLSDKDETICNLFDVMKMKKIYGRESRGIERSTFLIDKKGILRHEWRKVKVKEHVDEVLHATQNI